MTIDMPTPAHPLKIGTRASKLALAQAYETRDRLARAFELPDDAFEIVPITTTGDRITDKPLREIDGKGLFTKEVEEAILSGAADIGVHSTKDMPVQLHPDLVMECFLPREDPRDAFVSKHFNSLADMPAGAVVGTSSTRRRAQLLHKFPHLNVVEFRGNVQTRLQKLDDGVADATFLAMAGLSRLDMAHVARGPVDITDMLPAIAQGAIGIEHRKGDDRVAALLAGIHHTETGQRLAAERAMLARLDGSCETPIGGLAIVQDGHLTLRGEILRPDGSQSITDAATGPVENAAQMGRDMADRLLAQAGADFFND